MKRNGVDFESLTGSIVEQLTKARGLGDVVAIVAQPTAAMIDALIGTDLKNCPACTERQEDLNNKFPINHA